MGLTLYVGADEAGHGSRKSDEIIVAAFSLYHGDGGKIHIPVGRNSNSAKNYLATQGKGWLFTLNGKFARESLTLEVPGLIDYWVRKNDLAKDDLRIASAFDGELNLGRQEQFKEEMRRRYNFSEDIDIRHHAKTQHIGKRKEKSYDSKLVWAADSIASNLFMESRKKINLRGHQQYVPVEN